MDSTDTTKLENYLTQAYLDPNLDIDILIYSLKMGDTFFSQMICMPSTVNN